MICTLTNTALTRAFTKKLEQVDEGIIEDAAEELRMIPRRAERRAVTEERRNYSALMELSRTASRRRQAEQAKPGGSNQSHPRVARRASPRLRQPELLASRKTSCAGSDIRRSNSQKLRRVSQNHPHRLAHFREVA
jgi:hypothetical protein